MFSKMMLPVVFVLAGFSLCVESGGFNIIPIDYSLGALKGRDEGSPECFIEFSTKQASTVEKLGEVWETCSDTEIKANKQVTEDLKKFSYNMAKIPNDICVHIDDNCRNKFAKDGDILAALDCYEKLFDERKKILNMAQSCRLKITNAGNERQLIKATKKNCTNTANYEYLEESDFLFKTLITTCDNSPTENSTTVSTTISTTQTFTQSPIRSTTPRIIDSTSAAWTRPIPTTEADRDTTTEASPALSTGAQETESTTKRNRYPWEKDPTTRRGRFPWN